LGFVETRHTLIAHRSRASKYGSCGTSILLDL
jgi:hypothetical protein